MILVGVTIKILTVPFPGIDAHIDLLDDCAGRNEYVVDRSSYALTNTYFPSNATTLFITLAA